MDRTDELEPYAPMWQDDRQQYCLFTIRSYGQQHYLILHKPSRTVMVGPDEELEQIIIQQMIAHGVEVLDDPPA